MPSAADFFQKAAFANFAFPVSHISVKGGLRDHVHEYPHSPGGAPEKLGRKLYGIDFTVPAHNTMLDWQDFYPGVLTQLMIVFEGGKTFDLVVPTIGTIQAYATEWSRDFDAKRRSGEDCKFSFREDQSGLFLVESLVKISANSLETATGVLLGLEPDFPGLSFFDAISALVNSILAISDQVQLFSNQIEAKASGLASLCSQLDSSLKILNEPVNHQLLDALHDVWASAIQLNKDALKSAKQKIVYTVPAHMPISQVAMALYGDSSRAMELLQMNAVNDAFSIPKGTQLRAYAA